MVKRLVFPVLMSLLVVAGLVLGGWQIQRAEWKTRLLTQLDAAWAMPPETPLTHDDLFPVTADDTYFRRGAITGTLLPARSVLVAPRALAGQPGAHLYTPLALAEGELVWVNRGFVVDGYALDAQAAPVERVRVRGLVHVPQWPAIVRMADGRYALFADQHEAGVAPVMLRALEPVIVGDGTVTLGEKPQYRNQHLSYALFWFAMAGLAGVFAAMMIRRSR